MQIHIQAATEANTADLLALYADMNDQPPLPEETWQRLWAEMQAVPHYTVYLAWDGEKPVGTFSLLYVTTPMHRDLHRYAIVDAVTVQSDRRGQGIGTAMMRWALEKAAADGCYKVMLSSNLKRHRAHQFYESLGFEQHGWSFQVQLAAETAG
ncbi:MAG: GNAT family N-acetyltransferase [Prochlorotrichaceae cyanobacterium]